MMNRVVLLGLCALIGVAFSQLPITPPAGCTGPANNQPVYTGAPTLLKTVKNGKLYQIGGDVPNVKILHMFGTPFEMGLAQGQLLKDEIQMISSSFWENLEQIIKNATGYPLWIDKLIYQVGLKTALDITYLLTELYTPDYYYEELRGVAEGSGVDYWNLIHLQLFPELIKAQCSMVGAWGPATQQTSNGSLIQLRALDFMTTGPMQSVPVVYVYHPNQGNGHAFATISWAGFIGAISGVSSAPVGYQGEFSRHGIPFHFLMRDILQWDQNVHDAINRAEKASRTCAIFLGVGDPTNGFRAMEYTYPNVTVYSDQTYPVYPNHPRMTGLVYIDKRVQPSADPCIANVLKAEYGSITPTTMIRDLAPMLQTGDAHAAVYDYAGDGLYFVYASAWVDNECTPGYDRQWSRVSLSQLWSEAPPTVIDS